MSARLFLSGQTNFLRMLWKFDRVYNAARQLGDHFRPVRYEMRPRPAPVAAGTRIERERLYVHGAGAPAVAVAAPAAVA